jgi:ATP-dependent Clp protease protease subunit
MKWLLLLSLITFNAFAKEIVLTDQNCVSLRGPVTGASVTRVMQSLTSVSKTGNVEDPIYLVLNTPGGSVMAGLDLMQYINTLRRPVHVVANFAASMGFHILQSSKIRYITQYGTIMSHRASGGFEGDIPHQVASRFKHVVDLVEKMDDQVISRTKGKYNRKSYGELIRDEYWSVGQNAIDDRFADSIAQLKCDRSLDGTFDEQVQGMFFSGTVTFSNCPLITQPLNVASNDITKVTDILDKVRVLEF